MNYIVLFTLAKLFGNLIDKGKMYGGGLIIFIGVLMIAVAAFKVGKGLMTQGKPNAQPINWFLCGGLLLAGGAFAFGGMKTLAKMSSAVGTTADDLTGEKDDNALFSEGGGDHKSSDIKNSSDDWK